MNARKMIVAIVLLGAMFGVPVAFAQSGPILVENGTTHADVPGPLVAFPDGTEVMTEPAKGPVQGIISQRNEVIEAGEVKVYIGGLVSVQSRDGWVGTEPAFYFDATNDPAFVGAELEDGWHIVLDEAE